MLMLLEPGRVQAGQALQFVHALVVGDLAEEEISHGKGHFL